MKTTENLSTMHIPGPLSSDPGTEEKWALVQRIAASEHFSRSVRLRDFLLYVGRQAVSANSSELNVQEVGFRVFGRSPDYDRSQDNIVRVNATELRRRIEAYFASAGQNEQLILEIPRGSYKPVFHHRTDAPQPTPEENKATPLPAKKRRWFRSNLIPGWILIASLSLSVLSGIWCLILLQQNRHLRSLQEPWSGKPAVASFWKNFLAGNGPIDIVLPDDSASVIEDITGVSINLNDYLSRNFLRNVQSMPLSDDRRGDVFQLYNHNLVTFGGVRAAQEIMSQLPPG